MSRIEDQLRAVMLAHDEEIPDGSALKVPPIKRRRTSLPLRQVLAWSFSLLVLGGVIATFGLHAGIGTHRSAGSANLSCPSDVHRDATPPWVPARPHGVNGAARLAPSTTPVRALVCAYIAPGSPAGTSGSVLLTGDLTGLAQELFVAPPAPPTSAGCTQNGGSAEDDYYLLGLSYPAGTEWVASGNFCQTGGATNGVFSTTASMGDTFASWYEAGHWTAPANAGTACTPGAAGRYGQQTSLVPQGAVAVDICKWTQANGGRSTERTVRAGLSGLIAAFDQLPTHTTTHGCVEQKTVANTYNLLFSYATGPPVLVIISENCLPAIDNGNLQADDATTVLPLIRNLLQSR